MVECSRPISAMTPAPADGSASNAVGGGHREDHGDDRTPTPPMGLRRRSAWSHWRWRRDLNLGGLTITRFRGLPPNARCSSGAAGHACTRWRPDSFERC